MLEKTDKTKEIADKVGNAILNILGHAPEDIRNIDCVTGILMGATAAISCVHRSMDEDNYKELTASALTLWADLYNKRKVVNPRHQN